MQIIGYNYILKNSKFRYNWIFKIIIGYYNLIFLISVVLSLMCFFYRLRCILEIKTAEGWLFQGVHLCIWTIEGHKLGTLTMQVHNSLTVHNNLWALKFDNFSESQTTICGSSPPPASLWRIAYENRYVTHPLIWLIYLTLLANFPIMLALLNIPHINLQ